MSKGTFKSLIPNILPKFKKTTDRDVSWENNMYKIKTSPVPNNYAHFARLGRHDPGKLQIVVLRMGGAFSLPGEGTCDFFSEAKNCSGSDLGLPNGVCES